MQKFKIIVPKQNDGETLLNFLKSEIKLSYKIIQKVKYGGLKVNGETAFTTTLVKVGDLVEITLPKDTPNEYIRPLFIPLKVLYEDEYLIAVNKPSGMLTHNSISGDYSLENALAGYFYPNPFTFRAVNRLDKDTSGIVLVAKDTVTASYLSMQIKNGDFIKKYKAIVCGKPPERFGIISAPIKRQSEGNIKRIISSDGQEAITKYRLEKVLDDNLCVLSYELVTGRTHQIRLHSAHIGCPLYADKLYGNAVEGKTYKLQAYFLQLKHPFTNQTVTLEIKFEI